MDNRDKEVKVREINARGTAWLFRPYIHTQKNDGLSSILINATYCMGKNRTDYSREKNNNVKKIIWQDKSLLK